MTATNMCSDFGSKWYSPPQEHNWSVLISVGWGVMGSGPACQVFSAENVFSGSARSYVCHCINGSSL